MLNKKIIILGVGAMFVFAVAKPSYALNLGQFMRDNKEESKEERKEVRQELREEVRENVASRSNALKQIKEKFIFARLSSAEVTAINGTTLTVTQDDKTYTVLTDDKIQWRRKFWGKSSLSEISVGDKLNVFGKWTDDTKATIQAQFIRNISIQKRYGVFFGTVTAASSSGFTIDAVSRGTQTVTTDAQTKIVNRNQETISLTDIAVGHRVRVRGLWDSVNNTITQVTQVKDFSLPIQVKASPAPSVSPLPSVNPSPTPEPSSTL